MTKINYFNFNNVKTDIEKDMMTLKGILNGIAIDSKINDKEISELNNWCIVNTKLKSKEPYASIICYIQNAIADNVITQNEYDDILWACNKATKNLTNSLKAAIQQMEGIFHGVLADNVITDEEIKGLSKWVNDNEHLKGTYPYDEVESLICNILSDGKITDDERNMLKAFLGQFVDTTVSYNISRVELDGLCNEFNNKTICMVNPEIDFIDHTFSFTGKSLKATRSEIADIVENKNGVFNDNVTLKTDYLIYGTGGSTSWCFTCYGRKIEKAIEMRKNGHNIAIIHENDFWDCVVE